MKKYKDIMKDISDNTEKMTMYHDEAVMARRMMYSIANSDNWSERFKQMETSDYKKACKTANRMNNAEKRCEIKGYFLRNNAKIALFNEILPVFVETINRFKGKRYGEKTRLKISDEIQSKCGCRVFIETSYNEKIMIYGLGSNCYNVHFSGKYENGEQKKVLIDNVIQEVSVDDFSLDYINRTYYENIDEHLERLEDIREQVNELHAKMKVLIDEYNNGVVDGVPNMTVDNYGVR